MRFLKMFVPIPLIILFMSFTTQAFAQTIIPKHPDSSITFENCETQMKEIEALGGITTNDLKKSDGSINTSILACAIMTGRVHLFMIPFYLVYLIDLLVKLGATLCVLFIVIGGIMYAVSGISDEKEKAKKTIMNAIIGLIISTLSWIIINIIQVAVTSG